MAKKLRFDCVVGHMGIGVLLITVASGSARSEDAEQKIAESKSVLEEIVVTGATRLGSGFESPKPVTVIDRQDLDVRGVVNVADYLNELPSFRATTTPQTTGSLSSGNGVNGLDLRGLGVKRTLVLIDGKRPVPSNVEGTVDINVVPQALISRVEVVTGGGSAQWGSDAIAGVVNLSTDRKFEGIKLDSSYGESAESDAQNDFLSFAFGKNFSDGLGHFAIAAEYQENHGINGQSDRDWGRDRWGIVNNPDDTGPNDGIPARIITKDVVFGLGTDGGYIPLALGNAPPVSQIQFGPGGSLLPYDIGQYPIPNAFAALPFQVGGDGKSLGDEAVLSVPYKRTNFMFLGNYEISPTVRLFLDASYAKSEARSNTVTPLNLPFSGPDVISVNNAFLPAELKQIMAENGVPAIAVARTNGDHGIIQADSDTETYRFVGGVDAEYGKWNVNGYASYGKTEQTITQINNINRRARNFALNAVLDPTTNSILCGANLAGANGAPGCVPLNIFGDGAPSQAALDYIHANSVVDREIELTLFSVSANAGVFDLPAGTVELAFGAEYREEKASTSPDELSAQGLLFVANTSEVSGKVDVNEAFLEVGLPVLATDAGMTLDFTAAARYTDYSSSGGVTTWQTGFRFSPISEVAFRGTVSRDIRAPNITELVGGKRNFFSNLADPFSGQTVLVPVVSGSNDQLKPEESDTFSVGIVYQPEWFDGLSTSVDWYKIEINDAINSLPGQTIVDNCHDSNIGCELLTIENGQLTSVDASRLNVAEQTAEGVDFKIQYTNSVGPGTLSLRWLGNYIEEQSFSADSVTVTDDAGVLSPDAPGGTPTPDWRWNLGVDYSIGNFGAFTQLEYVGGGDYLPGLTKEDINDNSVDSIYYVNLSVRYDFETFDSGDLQFYAGVDNIFDESPPISPLDFVANYATNLALYDVVGRYFYVGIRFEM